MGVRFLFDIPHVTYPRRSDSVQEGVANSTILPVDGFGTIEVDLNRPGSTNKTRKWLPSRMCRLFHGTCCLPPNQWSNWVNRLSTTNERLCEGGFRGKSRSFSISAPARDWFL